MAWAPVLPFPPSPSRCLRISFPARSGPSLELRDSSSTAWRALACPSGEAAFGACSPCTWVVFHCVRPSCLPVPRVAGCGPGAPAPEPACSCARDRTGRSAPGPSLFSSRTDRSVGAIDTPARLARPGPARAGANGHPRHRRINDTPAHTSEVLLRPKGLTTPTVTGRTSAWRAGGSPNPPSGRRPMAPERAGPERPERRVETLAPTERLLRGRGTARVRPPIWPARSHAQAGRRAALDAPPERPRP